MTGHETSVRSVRNESGYDIGVAAYCSVCDWWGDLQGSYYLATVDLLNHVKRGNP
jgi:hypothetical protein